MKSHDPLLKDSGTQRRAVFNFIVLNVPSKSNRNGMKECLDIHVDERFQRRYGDSFHSIKSVRPHLNEIDGEVSFCCDILTNEKCVNEVFLKLQKLIT